jgi:hypothetical protein
VIDNGRLVAAWGDTQRPQKIHFARESFVTSRVKPGVHFRRNPLCPAAVTSRPAFEGGPL